jgi:hypothetical protein
MLALALIGCNVWFDGAPTCEYDVYDWSDDVTAHILAGDGSGSFSYDPADDPRTRIDGDYDPSTGDFAWKASYDDDYWLSSARVEGYGTAYHNGNLDVLFETVTTDVLDQQSSTWTRMHRRGCQMSMSWWADGAEDDALVASGAYEDDDAFQWVMDYAGYDWRGSWRRNQSRTEVIDADDGSYFVSTVTQADGLVLSDLEVDCYDGYFCEGATELSFSGTELGEVEVFDGNGGDRVATVSWSFQYDGDGEQTIAYDGGDTVTCTYQVDGDDCSYDCDDGSGGSC